MNSTTHDPRTRPAGKPPGDDHPPDGDGKPAAKPDPRPAAPPPAPRRRWPRLVIPLTLVAAAAGFGVWRYEAVPAEEPAELALQGNIDVRQVNLAFKVAGRIATLAADEGDAVKAGQVVATLDERYFRDDLRLARADRDNAAANLERLKNGFRPEEIETARAQEAERQATLKRAEQDFRRVQSLSGTSAVSHQEYDQAQAALREAEARLRSAAASRKLYEIGSRKEDIAAAQAQYDAAVAKVIVSERNLADSSLYAPNDGTILTRARERGAIVNAGETVFTLTLASPVWVRTYVNEQDLGRVQPGMPAAVTTDSAPGRAYRGHVGFISPTAEFTPKTVETRELRTDLVYRLRVVVDDPDGGLRQGMPVTVRLALPGPRPKSFWKRVGEALYLDRLGLTDGR